VDRSTMRGGISGISSNSSTRLVSPVQQYETTGVYGGVSDTRHKPLQTNAHTEESVSGGRTILYYRSGFIETHSTIDTTKQKPGITGNTNSRSKLVSGDAPTERSSTTGVDFLNRRRAQECQSRMNSKSPERTMLP
jgi:hypothetical protein